MKNSKIIIEPEIRQKIIYSNVLTKNEKDNFLRFVWYLTEKEKKELLLLI